MNKNDNHRSNHQRGQTITVICIVLLFILLTALVVFATQKFNFKTVEQNNFNKASVIIFIPDDSSIRQTEADWLSYSFEQAGMPVMIKSVSSGYDNDDYSHYISGWVNWKTSRSIQSDDIWIIALGIPGDYAYSISQQWDHSNLLMAWPDDIFVDFADWQSFTADMAKNWPSDKTLLVFTDENTSVQTKTLFEAISSEDAWLFPGLIKDESGNLSLIQSSDARFALYEFNKGGLTLPSMSSSYVNAVTSAVLTRQSAQIENTSDIYQRIQQASREVELMSFVYIAALLLFILIIYLTALKSVFASRQKISDTAVESFYEPNNSSFVWLLNSLPLMLSSLAIVFLTFNLFGILGLSLCSWWLKILIFVSIMIVFIPDARIGIADRDLEKTVIINLISVLTWLLFAAFAVWLLLSSVLLKNTPSDSIIWLLAGIAVLFSAKLAVRQLSAADCKIWLSLPLSALLALSGLNLILVFV